MRQLVTTTYYERAVHCTCTLLAYEVMRLSMAIEADAGRY